MTETKARRLVPRRHSLRCRHAFRGLASLAVCVGLAAISPTTARGDESDPMNVLFIISDDLTANALSCYGNELCQTPNIDRLAESGTRFTRAYCNATYCGPSRASFLSGYYPHATGVLGYTSPRPATVRHGRNTS